MNGFERISRTLFACLASVLLAGATMAPIQAQTPVVRFVVERFMVEGDNPLSEVRTPGWTGCSRLPTSSGRVSNGSVPSRSGGVRPSGYRNSTRLLDVP